MRIGIDLDDTICRTSEIVHDRLEKYAKKEELNPLDIMNDEDLKREFFSLYLEDIYTNVEIKRNVKDVLKRLKSKKNEIYIITARRDKYLKSTKTVAEITTEWFKKQKIEVDKIITSAYGEEKALACKKYKIDLMIEDNPYNYKKIKEENIKCILFDDRARYELKTDYITNWLDIEKYIERNR